MLRQMEIDDESDSRFSRGSGNNGSSAVGNDTKEIQSKGKRFTPHLLDKILSTRATAEEVEFFKKFFLAGKGGRGGEGGGGGGGGEKTESELVTTSRGPRRKVATMRRQKSIVGIAAIKCQRADSMINLVFSSKSPLSVGAGRGGCGGGLGRKRRGGGAGAVAAVIAVGDQRGGRRPSRCLTTSRHTRSKCFERDGEVEIDDNVEVARRPGRNSASSSGSTEASSASSNETSFEIAEGVRKASLPLPKRFVSD